MQFILEYYWPNQVAGAKVPALPARVGCGSTSTLEDLADATSAMAGPEVLCSGILDSRESSIGEASVLARGAGTAEEAARGSGAPAGPRAARSEAGAPPRAVPSPPGAPAASSRAPGRTTGPRKA